MATKLLRSNLEIRKMFPQPPSYFTF